MRRIMKAFRINLRGRYAVGGLVATVLFIGLILYLIFWNTVFNNNLLVSHTVKNAVSIAFSHINDLVINSENVVIDNAEYFLSDDEDNNNLETFRVVRMIEALKSDRPYVEQIAFYRKNGKTVITDDGITTKDIFFNYEFSDDDKNVEFWDELMKSYSSPTIVPVTEYKVPTINAFEHKRIFVVPKIYSLYDVGVLIFVNEANFLKYCGLEKTTGQLIFSMYNNKGELVLGENGSEPRIDIKKVSDKGKVILGMFGKYYYEDWFEYEDLVFTLRRSKPMPQMLLYISIILILMAVFIFILLVYIKKIKNTGNSVPVNERTVLYACMTDENLLGENENIANKFSKGYVGLVLSAIICKEVGDRQHFSSIVEKMMMESTDDCRIIARKGNAIIVLIRFKGEPKNLLDEAKKKAEKCINNCKAYSVPEFICGNMFYNMAGLSSAYKKLMNAIQEKRLCGEGEVNIPVLSDRFKLQLVECIAGGKYTKLLELIRKEATLAAEQGIPNRVFPFYLAHVYFEIAEVYSRGNEKFVNDTWKMFFESMEYMKYSFNGDTMINMLQNTLIELRQNISKNSESTFRIAEIIEYINLNYKKDLYLDAIAEKFSMSPKQFSAFFKNNAGVGFVEYLTRLRIEEAKNLLIDTDKSIIEISEEVGYNNNTTFTMAFKKYTGKSPGQFRESGIQ